MSVVQAKAAILQSKVAILQVKAAMPAGLPDAKRLRMQEREREQ